MLNDAPRPAACRSPRPPCARPTERAAEIFTGRPASFRVLDFLLDGKDNYQVDRDAAEALLDVAPDAGCLARLHRAFRNHATRKVAEAGISRFLDLGVGLPGSENVHEVAARVDPHSRVVYVDDDPVVAAHARARLLLPSDRTAFVQSDLRNPAGVLNAATTRRLIDTREPLAVLLTDVVHLIPDDLASTVDAYVEAMAPGSYLILSAVTSEGLSAEVAETMARLFPQFNPYSRKAFADLCADLEILDPGMVNIHHWWHGKNFTEPLSLAAEPSIPMLVAVGRKPGGPTRRICGGDAHDIP